MVDYGNSVDYKEMYLVMVRASEKAIRILEEGKHPKLATAVLISAQQICEEMYLSPGTILPFTQPDS